MDAKQARQIASVAKKAFAAQLERDETIVQGFKDGAGIRKLGQLTGLKSASASPGHGGLGS